MASKEEVVGAIQKLQGEIEETVSSIPEEGWSKGVYENGWNARELLCHIASMSGTAGFVLRLASMPSSPSLGAGYDEDVFNARLVAERQDKSPAELVAEVKSNFERDIGAARSAPDDLIHKHFRAPWDVEGELGDVIVMSMEGHLGVHLRDLGSVAGG